MDNPSKFYLLLLCGLAFAGVSSFADQLLAFAGFAVFLIAAIIFSNRFPRRERGDAWKLLAIVAVLAALLFNTRVIVRTGFSALAIALAIIVAVYVAFKLLMKRNTVGTVVGSKHGFVMVETKRALLSNLAPGVYAVECGSKLREGAQVELRVKQGVFGPPKPVEVLPWKKKA